MIKTLSCLLFAAAAVAANPYVLTVLNEVSVDSARPFVELHGAPDNQSIDLNGWQLVTTMSACTLTHYLEYNEFLVIDSEALALGEVAHGSLLLNPLEDSVFLLDDTGRVADWVSYPRYPPGRGKAPVPPIPGSIAFWNYAGGGDQSMNWYIDSTPTPGSENGDFGMIGGAITGAGGVTLDEGEVIACGQSGRCHRWFSHMTGYIICGLGAGTYQVSGSGIYNGQSYVGVYPESVTVGYSQLVGWIDRVLTPTGVAELPSAQALPVMRVSGRTLLLSGDGTAPVEADLYDQLGSRISKFHVGPFTGEKRLELPATLPPGIYFAAAQKGTYRTTVKVVLW